ncbi:MAG TPA: DUF502 domain-containing protein [Nitrospira sp.]|jgi:uncharacterized membrane protein|nr:DUF502 domain-containing protein [Nitrospira sp.]
MMRTLSRYLLTGLLVLLPTWATVLILSALLSAVNRAISDLLGQMGFIATPFIGILSFMLLVLAAGAFGTHLLGSRIIAALERWITQIPLVRSIYLTIKGMTDLFQFRSRFGRSTVIAFPFPRDGVWALGFVMGPAPKAAQVDPSSTLLMVFVPTAIHPFTGYLAFVPQPQVRPLNLLPEDAMKMEFSAGFYKPADGWLGAPRTT